MKKKRRLVVFALIINLVILNLNGFIAYAANKTPENIKVGLLFNNSAKAIINLRGESNISVGKYEGNKFVELLNLGQNNNIQLRKDSFYIGSNGDYVEFTGDVKAATNVKGPFHVQIGDSFGSMEQAQELINTLNIDEPPYLVYEGGWKVFAGLYVSADQAQNAANIIQTTSGINTTVISPSTTRVQVLNLSDKVLFMFDSKEEIHFKTSSVIKMDGRNYRGSITIIRQSSSDMTVINYLPLEEYLYGVVPKEMPALWPREALKAQAVAARSFATTSYNKFSHLGFNVCNTVNSQVYEGFEIEHPNSNAAVDETRGKVIMHNGKVIDAYFHSNSGGHTENSENIWSAVVPYIRGVRDDYSLDAPNSNWQVAMSKDEIKEKLEQNGIFIGEVLDIVVTSRSINGRILTLEVVGTNGKEIMQKQRSRTVFGLRSSWFDVVSDASSTPLAISNGMSTTPINLQGKQVITSSGVSKIDNLNNTRVYNGQQYKEVTVSNPQADFVFNGRGFGHGLGMSQHGAKKMAELNLTYIDILTHYYTGVKVE